MNTSIIKMSNAYDYIDLCGLSDNQCAVVDFRNVSGTRCYLDDEVKKLIEHGLMHTRLEGLHFIDSGNYHYLSLLYISRIDREFDLLLIDNHPDMKAPCFGDITTCGGWVLEACETLPHLRYIYMLGVKPELIAELEPLPKHVRVIQSIDEINEGLDIYLSIDKDALSEKYAVTDWDQGDMTIEILLESIRQVASKRNIIGVDICGDISQPGDYSDAINYSTNKMLYDCLTEVL